MRAAIITSILLAGCLRPATAAAQERIDPMAASVVPWFTMIERSFVSLADAMPADRWTFAPKDGEFKGVRTFGQQVKHVACANYGFFNQVEHKEPPPNCEAGGPSPATTKPELMQYLRESFAYAGQVMRRPSQRPRPGRRAVRRQDDAAWDRDAGGLARDRSLRAAGRLSANERHRAAGLRRHRAVRR